MPANILRKRHGTASRVYVPMKICSVNFVLFPFRGSRPQIVAGRFFDSEKSAPGNLAETIERCGEHKIMRIRGGRMR